ncbi:MAG: hypothetical protein LBP95_00320 [Deltaproteobacteria bacterium]|jgi:hypothetical protein|nr:hypothetical protein [Deltaproteobacteria bacterium]
MILTPDKLTSEIDGRLLLRTMRDKSLADDPRSRAEAVFQVFKNRVVYTVDKSQQADPPYVSMTSLLKYFTDDRNPGNADGSFSVVCYFNQFHAIAKADDMRFHNDPAGCEVLELPWWFFLRKTAESGMGVCLNPSSLGRELIIPPDVVKLASRMAAEYCQTGGSPLRTDPWPDQEIPLDFASAVAAYGLLEDRWHDDITALRPPTARKLAAYWDQKKDSADNKRRLPSPGGEKSLDYAYYLHHVVKPTRAAFDDDYDDEEYYDDEDEYDEDDELEEDEDDDNDDDSDEDEDDKEDKDDDEDENEDEDDDKDEEDEGDDDDDDEDEDEEENDDEDKTVARLLNALKNAKTELNALETAKAGRNARGGKHKDEEEDEEDEDDIDEDEEENWEEDEEDEDEEDDAAKVKKSDGGGKWSQREVNILKFIRRHSYQNNEDLYTAYQRQVIKFVHFKKKYHALKKLHGEVAREKRQLERDLTGKSDNFSKVVDEKKKLQESARSYQDQMLIYKQKLDEHINSVGPMEEENERLQDENTALSERNESLEELNQQLREENDYLRMNPTEQSEINELMKVEMEELQAQNEEMRLEKKGRKDRTNTIEALNQTVDKLRRENDSLKSANVTDFYWEYPDTLHDVVEAGKHFYGSKLVFHPRVDKSIDDFSKNVTPRIIQECVKMIKAVGDVLHPMKFRDNEADLQKFTAITGIDFSMGERKTTNRSRALDRERTAYYEGRTITFYPHLKSTISGVKFRIHLSFLESEQKIIICHIGGHLTTSYTRKL